MFCELGESCGGIDRWGKCRPVPTDCPNEDQPVCACNGQTYSSPCYAAASLQTIDYEGPCMTGKK